MDLSIVIVNYNVKYFLEQCLFSVLKACRNLQAEIFVVDNSSTDGSREYLESRFPAVTFKWNNENTGFAKANNSVIPFCTGDYILFLNPDIIVAEDTFERCLQFAKSKSQFGGLGIRMIDGSGMYLKESKRSFPSLSAAIFKFSGLHRVFPRSEVFAKYYSGHLHESENNQIDVLAGAFMLLSKKSIELTNGFDEKFFMYGEDIDLSYRIIKGGLKNYYFAESTIIHFKGESTQKRSLGYYNNFYGAMQLFVKKHQPGNKAAVLSASIGIMKILSSSKLLLKARGANEATPQPRELVIAADMDKFNKVIHLIKHSSQPLTIRGRLSIKLTDPDLAIVNVTMIEKMLPEKQFNALLFCEGELSFKTIIQLVEKYKMRLSFLFHADGSQSIIGSNDRNKNGFAISPPSL